MSLAYKIKESIRVIKKSAKESKNLPIIVNFSGGKDSLLLLDLVKSAKVDFICFYCATGLEIPGVLEKVKKTANDYDLDLYCSTPFDHKGTFFQRLKQFRYFPLIKSTWCSRDLKWRPQKKALTKIFGKNKFYKLNAVRKYESSRRKAIYDGKAFFWKDWEVSNDIMVFPVILWTTWERDYYLKKRNVEISTNQLYKEFKVSGCAWCPFYQTSIYRRILRKFPNLYDRIIKWEIKLNKPSINGKKWLRDLKDELINNRILDEFIFQDTEKAMARAGLPCFQKTLMDFIEG